MYHRFDNRVEISAVLVAQSGLHVGAGQESFQPMAVQGAYIKDNLGRPLIPGSSIKGVLRAFLESVQHVVVSDAKPVEPQGNVAVACKHRRKALERGVLSIDDKNGRETYRGYLKKQYPEASDNELDEFFVEGIETQSCLACQLFGSPVLAGKVKCADAVLAHPDNWLQAEIRTGNAIDSDTHTAAQGALFNTEVIPAGTEFSFKVIAENLTSNQAQCLGEVLSFFAQGGINLGGRIRSGLGHVTLQNIGLKTSYFVRGGGFLPKTVSRSDIATDQIGAAICASLIPTEDGEV
jgi:CRISPR-associated RAMP protein (TIGR02581 family)